MNSRISLVAVALFSLAAATAGAQDPVKWTTSQVGTAVAGGTASVKLVAAIEEGWHIYSLTQGPGGPTPSRITLPDSQPFALAGTIKADAPDVQFDKNFGINVETYEHAATFTVPVAVDKSAKPGAQQVRVNTRYQVCNASMCLPPKTVKLAVDVKVKGKSGKSSNAATLSKAS